VRFCVALTSVATIISSVGNAWGAPVTFNTALPVGGGEFVVRELVMTSESGDDLSAADRDVNATSLVSVLGYGVTPKLALFAVVPYADKDLGVTVSGNRVSRDSNGLGDVSVFGRFTLIQRDQPGRTFRVAPFLGLKAPTGEDDERDNLGRLPPGLQAGTGAWDVFGGVVATYQTFAFQADGQVSYRINSEANEFDPGDEFRLDGSLQYRLWPRSLGEGVPSFLYGVLESNLVYRDNNQMDGATDDNSGGTTLYLSPGLQYVTKRWILEGVVQLPVIQNLHGDALENDYVVHAGLRFNF
jgi:hypothetical protein